MHARTPVEIHPGKQLVVLFKKKYHQQINYIGSPAAKLPGSQNIATTSQWRFRSISVEEPLVVDDELNTQLFPA